MEGTTTEPRPMLKQAPDEHQLIVSASRGDNRAFNAIVDQYKDRVFAQVRRRVRDQHQAEDIAQEVFLRLFRAAASGNFAGRSRLSTWLYTITSNCIADHFRSTGARSDVSFEDTADPRDGPTAQASTGEQRQIMAELVRQLPDEQRQVVEMRILDNLSFAEIAELIGIPIPTAKSRMAYALRKIETALRGRDLGRQS
jgi:RNA polymerase sigma-70 factor (ECF subfamily)